MATNGHMEWFEQMDLKEQQNIIDSVNHIGRIVKRYASCNIDLRAFGEKAVCMPNYLQLGNCLQFSTLFGHIWDNWGNYRGNLRHFWGILWHCKENCETQPPASIGWVALSSLVRSSFVVCPASVTSPLISTIWCFRAYNLYIFCEDMILATCQCQHIFCCWVEHSLLLSSYIFSPN